MKSERTDEAADGAAVDGAAGGDDVAGAADVCAEIGALPGGAIVTEAALARMFGRHTSSIKKAVDRGEFPPPARLLGGCCWTARAIVAHIEKRLSLAAADSEQAAADRKRILREHAS